jgi:23S rRNA (guanosine2251-2'-O)-methyltransferase
VTEAIRAGLVREVRVAPRARSTPGLRDLLSASDRAGVPVVESRRDELDRLAPDHQGVAARVAPPNPLGDADLAAYPFGGRDVVVILDGITDPHNLGAAARVAEAAGVAMLVTRERRAAGLTPAAVRASAGALLHLPTARVTNLRRSIDSLQRSGFTVVGLDGSADASVMDRPCPDGPVALVVGSEGEGLSRLVREGCDLLVALPMRGRVDSLNASTALAAALYAYVLPSREARG